jgi:hypothetical protein
MLKEGKAAQCYALKSIRLLLMRHEKQALPCSGDFRRLPQLHRQEGRPQWFAIAVFGVMLANDTYGPAAIIRELDIQGRLCVAFDSFFRSSVRELRDLHMARIYAAIRLWLIITT